MQDKIEKDKEPIKGFFDILESFVLAIACVIFFFIFAARLSIVDGSSMNSTLYNKDYLIVFNLFFTYEPKNNDIVVVHGGLYAEHENGSGEEYSVPIVKRVVATEGQTIEIDYTTSQVYIDGKLLDEEYAQYINPGYISISGGYSPYSFFYEHYNEDTGIFTATVPQGTVFVMGDNRNHSADSRIFGFVPKEYIVGKVIFRIFPFSRAGLVR